MGKSVLLGTRSFGIARLAAVLVLGSIALSSATVPSDASSTYQVDFTDYQSGPVAAWLKSKGFEFERDAGSDKIALSADPAQGLELEALKPAQGLLMNSSASGPFSTVEIEWGVSQHPDGASYEKQINNEAIMVHVFFGSEKMPSGSLFAPDAPYFIGLFLCNGDRIGHAYVGRYYQEGGRYVCLESPTPGQMVTSRFDLKDAVKSIFGESVAAMVTGYSVEVDTSESKGKSSAFIKRISFLP